MVQYLNPDLDKTFSALSDSTRRGILERLGREEMSISDLADQFNMTLTGMKKHISILEEADLVATEKIGRTRICRVGKQRLEQVNEWIANYQRLWDARLNELDQVIETLKQKEKSNGSKERN